VIEDIMKACRVQRFGPPEVISLEDIDHPEPNDQEAVVRVDAAGVGPWDAWIRSGKSVLPQPLPLTLGSDLSGTIVALGAAVRGFRIGQAVYGVTNPRFTGAYAEYAVASASMLAPKPRSSSDFEAASLPVVAVTALQMLLLAQVRSGQRVLIHGAGGSVGAIAVQLALASGAHVMGTDVQQGVRYAESLGVSRAIDVETTRFEDVTEPVDAVIDTVGGDVQTRSFAVLKRGGNLVSSVAKPNAELASRCGVSASFILVDVTTDALTQVAQLVDAGRLKTRLGAVLPLADARRAHEMLDGKSPRPPGKIVLSVGS
jgi:NADPH:quinone reductase-like Zn-dependent oxidoreductase